MRLAAIVALVFGAAGAAAEPVAVTSAYTKLDLDRCKLVGEGPQWAEWRCKGHGRIPLFVQNGDDRYDVDAGTADEDLLWAHSFDYPGEVVEWRIKAGVPFAIIYRLRSASPDIPASSKLVVETIGRGGKRGCRVAQIDGAVPNANVVARRAADALLSTTPACLRPQ